MGILKYIRVVVAVWLFLPITLFFIDFLGWFPLEMHALLHLQLLPAVMKVNVGVLLFLLLLTLLMGRLYCSTICPLGVLQDLFFRLSKLFLKDKNRSRRKKQEKLETYKQARFSALKIFLLKRTFFARPTNWLRYGVLALVVVGLLVGLGATTLLADLVDPYSNFGRIATNLFRPLAVQVNNLAAELLNSMNNYSVYKVNLTSVEIFSLLFSSAVLLVVFLLSFTRGRLYCNSFCPVGTFLGLLSKVSFLKIGIDANKCNSCGLCEFNCKSQCIDSQHMQVNTDRCVTCFNCLSRCKQGAISYRVAWPLSKPAVVKPADDKSRRTFLTTAGALVAAAATSQGRGKGKGKGHGKGHGKGKHGECELYNNRPAVMPPGAVDRKRFLEKCTACQLCITKCPSHVLKPAITQYGWEGVMHPRMDFSNSFCNYACTDCSSVCPNDALKHLTQEEKQVTQVGVVYFARNLCVVVTDEASCGACSEHCPTQAVHMVEYKNGLTIPQIDPDICIGCGGCESICPVRPAKAIYINGNTTQVEAEKPVEEEAVENTVDDFGF